VPAGSPPQQLTETRPCPDLSDRTISEDCRSTTTATLFDVLTTTDENVERLRGKAFLSSTCRLLP
ncbi:MAG: hypothetical protein ACPG77_03745, partial [Nannocystaceae bacterium]